MVFYKASHESLPPRQYQRRCIRAFYGELHRQRVLRFGFGNYNGLEATLSRRFANGFSFRTAYTYSRSLDNTPQELESNSGAPPDGRNYGAWYSLSGFDIPHRFSANYVYELPFGKGKTFPAGKKLQRCDNSVTTLTT